MTCTSTFYNRIHNSSTKYIEKLCNGRFHSCDATMVWWYEIEACNILVLHKTIIRTTCKNDKKSVHFAFKIALPCLTQIWRNAVEGGSQVGRSKRCRRTPIRSGRCVVERRQRLRLKTKQKWNEMKCCKKDRERCTRQCKVQVYFEEGLWLVVVNSHSRTGSVLGLEGGCRWDSFSEGTLAERVQVGATLLVVHRTARALRRHRSTLKIQKMCLP